jgi:nucleotide-binding universal stress UspA family protein
MLQFRKVIFPIDYSECSLAAVPFVKELAQRFESELTLVHAYGSDVFPLNDMSSTYGDLIERTDASEQERLERFACESFGGVTFKTTVQMADAPALIQDLTQSQPADLVMLPTHGRGLWRRMLLGSVTAKVLHDVATPVWTATPQALRDVRTPYRSVLCACDINDASEATPVLQAAAAFASKYNANLSLLHIVELWPLASDVNYASFRATLIDEANTRLGELKHSLGISAPHQVTDGPVAAAIQREAEHRNADLIVMGRGHQRETVGRLWSSLYQVVHDANCPVISM